MIDSVSEHAGEPDFRGSRRPKTLQERGAATLDRVPPHELQMEMGVLGCIMLSPHECLNECITKFKEFGKEVFYDLRHQAIYETILILYEARLPVELISVQQNLKDRQLLEQVGGIAYISQIQDSVPSAANLGYYMEVMLEKFMLRRMIETCTGVVGRIYQYEGEVDQLLDEVEKEVLKVGDMRRNTDEMPTDKQLVNEAITQIETYFNKKGELTGLATGFPDLDRMTDGLVEGFYVIAGRPSTGKTSLAMNIAEHVVIELKQHVGVFSLEMSAQSLMLRMMCSVSRVNLRMIRDGFMSEADFPKLMNAAGKLAKELLHIDATAGLSIMQLRSRARRMKMRFGIKLLIVDYLQLLNSSNRKVKSRQEEIADISAGLKALSKELHIPIIALAQMSRDFEKNNTGKKKRKPRMSDLRESGAIEQDADLVAFLFNPNATDDEDEMEAQQEADGLAIDLLIAKQRNGPTGTVHLTFLKPYTRFESAAKFSNDDIPDGK